MRKVVTGKNKCGINHKGEFLSSSSAVVEVMVVWESSDVLVHKERGQKVYVNTVLLAASILLSGNNFSKRSLVSRCLNLGFISSATFGRIQKLYAIPAIQARELSVFKREFYELEEGILDPLNDTDMALHYVYQ